MNTLSEVALRSTFVAVALFLWFWTQRVISAKAPANAGLGDRLHDWSAPLHRRLTDHPRAADVTLIVTSALIDVFGLYLLASAVLGPTLRPFLGLLILFLMRQACQMICTLPIPQGSIWRYPGFPSLLVTYGTSNDFFFSGHTAVSVLGALYLYHTAPPWLAAIGIVVAAVEAVTVIVLRAHYTMESLPRSSRPLGRICSQAGLPRSSTAGLPRGRAGGG